MYVALTLFFAPTCRVHIHDAISHERFTVANVPWGLGLVAGTLSQMGDVLTREIEKTFSLPDDLKYHKTGAVMASNLIAQSRTFQVTNADLAETLRSFMNQCVVYDALLGKKYTLDDLRKTPDIWNSHLRIRLLPDALPLENLEEAKSQKSSPAKQGWVVSKNSLMKM